MSWVLHCAWCNWYIVVNNRGMRGADMGSGVDAAEDMENHVQRVHNRTWREFLQAGKL